jgi:hypothetical protein
MLPKEHLNTIASVKRFLKIEELNVGDILDVSLDDFGNSPGIGYMRTLQLKDLQSTLLQYPEKFTLSAGQESQPHLMPTELMSRALSLSQLDAKEAKAIEKLIRIKILNEPVLLCSLFKIDTEELRNSDGIGRTFAQSIKALQNRIQLEPASFVEADAEELSPEKMDHLMTSQLDALKHRLNANQIEVFCTRFGIGKEEETLQEIGDRLGCTRERIRQIEKDVLEEVAKCVTQYKSVGTSLIYKLSLEHRLVELFPNTKKLFSSDKSFLWYVSIFWNIDYKTLDRTQKLPTPSSQYLDELYAFFANTKFPVDTEILVDHLQSVVGLSLIQCKLAIESQLNKGAMTIAGKKVTNVKLPRPEAIANCLVGKSDGLGWHEISKTVNDAKTVDTPLYLDRPARDFHDNPYIFMCGRGTYRHLDFFSLTKAKSEAIIKDVIALLSRLKQSAIPVAEIQRHLPYPVDYFELRFLIRNHPEINFDGASNVDNVVLAEDYERATVSSFFLSGSLTQ